MQYFKNTPRCTPRYSTEPAVSDIFPLCRNDKAPQAEMAIKKNNCDCQKSSYVKQTPCADSGMNRASDYGCTGLAMAFVPEQEFDELNDTEEALACGTLFRKLDMPFQGDKRRNCKC